MCLSVRAALTPPYAPLAQPEEHLTFNQGGMGSNPIRRTVSIAQPEEHRVVAPAAGGSSPPAHTAEPRQTDSSALVPEKPALHRCRFHHVNMPATPALSAAKRISPFHKRRPPPDHTGHGKKLSLSRMQVTASTNKNQITAPIYPDSFLFCCLSAFPRSASAACQAACRLPVSIPA